MNQIRFRTQLRHSMMACFINLKLSAKCCSSTCCPCRIPALQLKASSWKKHPSLGPSRFGGVPGEIYRTKMNKSFCIGRQETNKSLLANWWSIWTSCKWFRHNLNVISPTATAICWRRLSGTLTGLTGSIAFCCWRKKRPSVLIESKHPAIQESYNTPLEHTPGNPPTQLWKDSLYSLLVSVGKGLGVCSKGVLKQP